MRSSMLEPSTLVPDTKAISILAGTVAEIWKKMAGTHYIRPYNSEEQ